MQEDHRVPTAPLSVPGDAPPARAKKARREGGNWLARWFFGVGKEFRRIQWMKGREVASSLLVVIVVVLVFIALFAAVDAVFLDGNILAG